MFKRLTKKFVTYPIKMFKKIYYIVCIIFLFTDIIYSQLLDRGIDNQIVLLYSLEGEKTILIDTLSLMHPDSFMYKFNTCKNHNGIYRITVDNNRSIDFVYEGEEISIKTEANNIIDNMVIESKSNQLYHNFIKLNKQYKNKTELLQLILVRYPKNDEYYKLTQDKVIQLQNEYLAFINSTVIEKSNSFISKYISSSRLPIIDFNFMPEEQSTYLKSHALDYVDFNDDGLIYSDAFTNKTIEYLTYYRNPQLPKDLLEKEFMIAVDTVLNKAKVNEIVYKHIVEYLIDGFKKFGFDNTLDYIVENYVIKDDLCLDVKTERLVKKRIDQGKFLHIGNVVPDIKLPDSTGKVIELNKIISNNILIIFYASWCPHCQIMLPQIDEIYKHQKEKVFEVIAVSLDTSKTDWLDFVRKNSFDWLNVSDLQGWNSKAASDYYLYATPTMFLVNLRKEIIGKPITVTDLLKIL